MKLQLLILIGIITMNGCAKNNQEEVAIVSTQFGDMIVEFYPDSAEKHVDSFITHVRNGYFDKTTFHRVIPGFVIQGGDPNSKDDDLSNDGIGGNAAKFYGIGNEADSTTWMLPAEFNNRPHVTGALSMARAQDPNSAGSQFFICASPVNQLDRKYTVFGQVIKGLEVIQQIVNTPRDSRDNPREKVEMTIKMALKKDILVP